MKANHLNASNLDAYRGQRDELKAKNVEIRSKLLSMNLDTELIRQIQACVNTVLNYTGDAPAEEKESIIKQLHEAPAPEPAVTRQDKSKSRKRE